jgi:hypothetical protein
MLTKNVIFGFNVLTVAGFLVLGMALHRVGASKGRSPLGIALMLVGTALVFAGMCVGSSLRKFAN